MALQVRLVALLASAVVLGAVPATASTQSGSSTTTFATSSCTTASVSPVPTGAICNQSGQLSKPNVIAQFPFVSGLDGCSVQCFQRLECAAFAYNGTAPGCQLLGSSLSAQGFQSSVQDDALRYSQRTCYRTNCPPEPITSCCATGCSPAMTQAVLNPSFEEAKVAAWSYSGGARVVTNASQAFQGRNFAFLSLKLAGNSKISQKLSNMATNLPYMLEYQQYWPSTSRPTNSPCNLSVTNDEFPVDGAFYNPELRQAYARRLGFFTPQTASPTLSLSLNCPIAGSSTAGQPGFDSVSIDNVKITLHQIHCRFWLRLVGNQSRLGPLANQYLAETPSGISLARVAGKTQSNGTQFRLGGDRYLFSAIGRIAWQMNPSNSNGQANGPQDVFNGSTALNFGPFDAPTSSNAPLPLCSITASAPLRLSCAQGQNTKWFYCASGSANTSSVAEGLYLAPASVLPSGSGNLCTPVALAVEYRVLPQPSI